MDRTILGVFSGKGGVGKTTIASNIAVILSNAGSKVTLIDCNFSASHLAFYFNLHFTPLTLNNVLRREAKIEDASYKYHDLKIVPASFHPYELYGVDISRLKKLIKKKLADEEYIILDTAPGFGKETVTAAGAVDKAIIVTTPHLPSIMDVLRGVKIIEREGAEVIGVVLNKVRKKNYELGREDVEVLTNLKVLGEIPFSEKFYEALSLRVPLVEYEPKSIPALRLYRTVFNITGKDVSPELSLWDRFKLMLTQKFRT